MSLKLFFLRGEIRYTPSERREKYNLVVKGERSGYRQDPVISIVQEIYWYTPDDRKEKKIWYKRHIGITLTAKGKEYEYTQIIQRTARLNHTAGSKAQSAGQSGDPHQAGRQDPMGKQRPSPARAPTRTSRRAGIGQGDLPHTKVTTSSLRMQGDRKEQHSSHSLNRWKERFDLLHRHAGMLNRE